MDVMLIKALQDYYQFDHPVEQHELRDHLKQVLHLNERDAVFALASLIANNYVQVYQSSMPHALGMRTHALLRPGPKLRDSEKVS